MLSSFRLW